MAPRPHFVMALVLDGYAVFDAPGKTLRVDHGEVFLAPVGSRYISHWKENTLNIPILFSFFPGTPFPGDKALEIQKITPKYEGEFSSLFIPAYRDFTSGGGCNFSSLSYFFEIMARITPRLVFSEKQKLDERIETVLSHIETHYHENTTTAYLASIAHMSLTRFHASFKSQVGETPIEYRNGVRIRYAVMALIQGGKSIETISRELGFESVTYFRRVFKKKMGCAPSQYADRHMVL